MDDVKLLLGVMVVQLMVLIVLQSGVLRCMSRFVNRWRRKIWKRIRLGRW